MYDCIITNAFPILVEIAYLIKLKYVISSAYWSTLVKQVWDDRLLIWK